VHLKKHNFNYYGVSLNAFFLLKVLCFVTRKAIINESSRGAKYYVTIKYQPIEKRYKHFGI
jgi:hypothetical protein